MKRQEFFAFTSNEFQRVIHFTRHFSKLAAEKHHGDAKRFYRGGPRSDFTVTIYSGRASFEKDLAEFYVINYKAGTLTPRENR